jgi:hypothetical protein
MTRTALSKDDGIKTTQRKLGKRYKATCKKATVKEEGLIVIQAFRARICGG